MECVPVDVLLIQLHAAVDCSRRQLNGGGSGGWRRQQVIGRWRCVVGELKADGLVIEDVADCREMECVSGLVINLDIGWMRFGLFCACDGPPQRPSAERLIIDR